MYCFFDVTHFPSVFDAPVLGIEITSQFSRCTLGNIDPQHGEHGTSKSSAIEMAMTHPLPPQGTGLVTDRPDSDSLGAMAVFHLRSTGRPYDQVLTRVIGRVDAVGEAGARAELEQETMSKTRLPRKAIIGILGGEYWPTIEKKVLSIARVLTGEYGEDDLHHIANLEVKVNRTFHFEEHADGKVALCTTAGDEYSTARSEAQKRFPIGLIYAPKFKRRSDGALVRRFTIVKQMNFSGDLRVLEKEINRKEAAHRGLNVETLSRDIAWGGPTQILSSPEKDPTMLELKDVLPLVIDFANKHG